jgi:lysophospholipase L1-like esterase
MDKAICIFGASITWGAFDSEKGGWANRLRLFLEKKYQGVDLYNLGISGDTTENVLRRMKNECEARDPDILIFSVGNNDSQYIQSPDNPRTPLEKFKANIRKIIANSRTFTNDILFTRLTGVDESKTMPIPWKTDRYYTNENIVSYSRAIRELCEEEKVLFLDMEGVLEKTDLVDGLHPNSVGHEKMFERVKDFLVEKIFANRME